MNVSSSTNVSHSENYLDHFSEHQTAICIQDKFSNLQYSPSGQLFSYSTDSSLKIYSALDMGLRNIISLSLDHMQYLQNNTVLYSRAEALFYLSVYDNKLLRKFDGHRDPVSHISVNSQRDTFMTVGTETVKMWDFRYNSPIFTVDFTGQIGAISQDWGYALCDGSFVYLYDWRNSKGPLHVKSIRPNFYRKMWYTGDSACICLSTLKTHMCLDSAGDPITSLSFENACDPDVMNESNILICGSSSHVYSYKIADKRTVGCLNVPGFQCETVRVNPVMPQFICASDSLIKAWYLPRSQPE